MEQDIPPQAKEEENVEYHIEIQNCDEDGLEPQDGEVTFVLDLGESDVIPENIAMQLAQLAADGSLNLSEGTNSIMIQNEVGDDGSHFMQVGGTEDEKESIPQVIQIQVDDAYNASQQYFTASDTTTSYIAPAADISFQDYFLPEEKSIFGKPKTRGIGSTRLLDRSSGRAERAHKSTSVGKSRSNTANHVNVGKQSKSTNVSVGMDVKEKKGRGDKLPIHPFLKGKTPVMLTVANDGKVIAEGDDSEEVLLTLEPPIPTPTSIPTLSSIIPDDRNQRTPIILDFNVEKIKLESASSASAKSILTSISDQPQPATEQKPPEVILFPLDVCEKQEAGDKMENPSSLTEDNQLIVVPEETPEVNDNSKQTLVSVKDVHPNMTNQNTDSNVTSLMDSAATTTTTSIITANDSSTSPTPIENTSTSMDMDTDTNQADVIPNKSDDKPSSPVEPMMECDYDDCSFESADPLLLAAHLEDEHNEPYPYRCFVCEKKFRLKVSLVIHSLIHQKDARPTKKKRGPYGARDKFYECPICSKQLKLKPEILAHVKSEHRLDKSDVFTCEACKFLCLSEEEMSAHKDIINHSADRRSYCSICNQTFTNIYQHKSAVHSDKRPFTCDRCGYSAKTKSSLRYHMVVHKETKDWKCSKCPYKTSSERRLKRHSKIHDPNKKHQCSKCNFATHDSYEFKRHFSKVHGRVKSYDCKFCGQTFTKHHEIRLHLMFEHECNDAFFCNFCDFTCSTRADYKTHIQTHYGQNKHVCEICGFTGRYRTHYRRHMLTHTEKKPFTCHICFKSVREASNLRRHMLTHTEDKPLACSVCGYRCKIRSRLMNHMKTHSELRPFACHLCRYTTKFNGNLMKHLENHAKYKPHKCQFCSYACNEKNKLKRHMSFKHPNESLEPKKEMVGDGGDDLSEISPKEELIVMPQQQEQYMLVSKDELGKIVQIEKENVSAIGALSSSDQVPTIVINADSQLSDLQNLAGKQSHIVVTSQGTGNQIVTSDSFNSGTTSIHQTVLELVEDGVNAKMGTSTSTAVLVLNDGVDSVTSAMEQS